MYVFLYVSHQLQPLSPSLQSQPPSVAKLQLPLACPVSHKHSAGSLQMLHVSPKFSFATLQSQTVCCNLLLATIQPQSFIDK